MTEESKSAISIASVLTVFGPSVLAVLISYALSARYTRRATKGAVIAGQIERIITKIEDVAQASSLYFLSGHDEHSEARSIVIQHNVSSISRDVHDLAFIPLFCKQNLTPPKREVIALRQSATGGDFQVRGRDPSPLNSAVHTRITLSKDALISKLRKIQIEIS